MTRSRASGIEPSGHTTQPPARYTEASLVAELERRAIGRPSTYASIIDKITNERGYVWKKGSALVPSWTAFAKIQLMERYFGHLVDYGFTATMEEALDEVAAGRAEAEKWLHAFYFGNGHDGLKELVSDERLAQDRQERGERGPHRCRRRRATRSSCGSGTTGRPSTGATRRRRSPPTWSPTSSPSSGPRSSSPREPPAPASSASDPETGEKVLALNGRFGPFVQLGELAEGSKKKPPRGVALLVDGPRHRHARRGAAAPLAAARRRRRRRRRRDHRPERPVRALPQEGHRQPQPRVRGAALLDHPRGGRGDLRPAQDPPGPAHQAAARRARRAPGLRCAGPRARRSLRSRTSPTAPPTPPCAGGWTRPRSRSTTRSSCSGNGLRAGRRRRRRSGRRRPETAKKKATKSTKTAVKQTTKRVVKKSATKKAAEEAGRERVRRRSRAPTVDDAPPLTDDDAS